MTYDRDAWSAWLWQLLAGPEAGVRLNNGTRLTTEGLLRIGPEGDVAAKFDEAAAAARSGRSFVWHMPKYYAFRLRMKQHLAELQRGAGESPTAHWPPHFEGQGQCDRLHFSYSDSVLAMRERFLRRLGLHKTPFVTLHVRRGDRIRMDAAAAKGGCNTSVVEIARYVACSYRKAPKLSSAPLILFTDERSPSYLLPLLNRLASDREAGQSALRIIHGDAVIERLLEERGVASADEGSDNYFVYAVADAIKMTAAGWLSRRHLVSYGWCNDCDDPYERRKEPGRDGNPMAP